MMTARKGPGPFFLADTLVELEFGPMTMTERQVIDAFAEQVLAEASVLL